MRLLRFLLCTFFNEVAVESELANQWIDLPQADRRLRTALQITANETEIENFQFQSGGTGIVDAGHAVFFGEGEKPQYAAHGGFGLPFQQSFRELADVRSRLFRPGQQLYGAE